MHKMIEAVAELFKQTGWNYELDADRSVIRTQVTGTNGDWQFWVLVQSNVMTMLSALPTRVPKARRSLCAELLTRINCTCKIGAFTVDFDDGQLFFRNSFLLTGEMGSEQLNLLVQGNLEGMNRYFPAIMTVLYAGIEPAVALERAKGDAQLVAGCGSAEEQLGGHEFPRWRN